MKEMIFLKESLKEYPEEPKNLFQVLQELFLKNILEVCQRIKLWKISGTVSEEFLKKGLNKF